GFVFDLGSTSATTTAALARIRELFGGIVADRVSSPDDTAIAGTVAPLSSAAIAEMAETVVFPVLGSVNARARDMAIVDDASRGVVKISMRLPWWAMFLRPWVTVRRRGRPEVIALGPMRRANGVHTAELHYGLPTPANSLVAEVIRGSRGAWMSALVAAVVTTALLLGGLTLREGGASQSNDSTLAAVETTAAVVDTTAAVTATSSPPDTSSVATTIVTPTTTTSSSTQKPVTTTAPPSSTTSVPAPTTTPSTILPPGGVNFDEPNQYITANDVRANVTVSNSRVTPGDSIDVAVRISGVFINPFSRTGIADLTELVNTCRSLIGAKTTTPPTPGWTTTVSVSLVGTGVTAGGITTLVVVGNIARECGNNAVSANPLTVEVVRLTFYREVPTTLRIPRSLKAGTYDLVLDALDFSGFTKTTPITLTVSG
ncbi:MAG: hypothetical protein ACKPCO_03340, partial [Actinomycetota bacterium]